METRAVYLDIGKISIKTWKLPKLGPNEVLVKVYQASICGSERYHYKGITVRPEDEARVSPEKHAYPMGPLGHEGGGTVIEAGSAVKEYLGGGAVEVGDRVGVIAQPTYTDYWIFTPQCVQPIPEKVSFEVGCLYEPLGCAAWAGLHTGVRPGDYVAVNGAGFAGNILLQGAKRLGASLVIAIDVAEKKLDLAKKLGADVTLNPRKEEVVERVNEITEGEGVDVAIEAVGGTGIGIVQSLREVRHNGIIALYGDNYAPIKEFCFHRFHEDGLFIKNLNPAHHTRLYMIEALKEGLRAVERGVYDVQTLLDHSAKYKLSDLPEVFRKETSNLEEHESIKTLIYPT
ncbi:zinc-dependent alcohol dehydrogenase [[Eubacterium] cellulosolvens]